MMGSNDWPPERSPLRARWDAGLTALGRRAGGRRPRSADRPDARVWTSSAATPSRRARASPRTSWPARGRPGDRGAEHRGRPRRHTISSNPQSEFVAGVRLAGQANVPVQQGRIEGFNSNVLLNHAPGAQVDQMILVGAQFASVATGVQNGATVRRRHPRRRPAHHPRRGRSPFRRRGRGVPTD
jgi:hypothetical protein